MLPMLMGYCCREKVKLVSHAVHAYGLLLQRKTEVGFPCRHAQGLRQHRQTGTGFPCYNTHGPLLHMKTGVGFPGTLFLYKPDMAQQRSKKRKLLWARAAAAPRPALASSQQVLDFTLAPSEK